ncbi:hypothetical protein [Psychrobacillus sp. FSL H8-0487]|uniref:hypothetical protein n=1 Tax=Psychrobacillus sp. FSL H8-0487 TaxID=2921391 RepID=UPI0030F4DE20
MYEHYVTLYLQEDSYISTKVLTTKEVPQFIEKHKSFHTILVCDPKNRTQTSYEYGIIKNFNKSYI